MSYLIFEKIKKMPNLLCLKTFFWIAFYTGILIGSMGLKSNVCLDCFSPNVMNFRELLILPWAFFYELQNIVLVFLCSFSLLGAISSLLFVFLKGLGIGIILSQMYTTYLFKGIVFGIFIFLPGTFISSTSLINFAFESFKFSVEIAKQMFPCCNGNNLFENLNEYIHKMPRFILLSLIGSIITIILCCTFSKFFGF